MKKNFLTKLLLTFVMLALIFSLAACNKDKDDPVVEEPTAPTAIEQLVGIIKGAGGLITTVNAIDTDAVADVAIAVNQKNSSTENKFALNIKGNLNATAPELAIGFVSGTTEQLAIGFKGKTLYLKQPLTSLNATADGKAGTPDAIKADVAALDASVQDGMYMLMDILKGLNIELDFDSLGDSIKDLLGDADLSTLITFTALSNGTRLEVQADAINLVKSLFLNKLLAGNAGGIINSAINFIFDTDKGADYLLSSKIYLEVYTDANKVISGLKIGFTATDNSTGDITININKLSASASDKIAIDFGSEYTAKSLNLGVNADLPQKGVSAVLDAIVTPDFSADEKVLASASLKFNNENTYVVPAYFNGKAVFFNTAGVYTALNGLSAGVITAPDATAYKATLFNANTTNGTREEDTTLVKIINAAVAKAKADYIADKAASAANADSTAPSKGLMTMIYKLIGGKLSKLTVDSAKNAYTDPTEAQMLEQVEAQFGEYLRFDVYSKDGVDTYKEAIALITNSDKTGLWDKNYAWIIGDDAAHTAKTYGIFDWADATWSGGAKLVVAGENNDLLDAVNVFFSNKGEDITTATVSDALNYLIAGLYYYDCTEDNAFVTAADNINKEILIAENIYAAADKSTAAKEEAAAAVLKTAKDAASDKMHLLRFQQTVATDAKNYGYANTIVKEILGVESDAADVLKELFDGGVYVGIACTKGSALNGSITIAKDNTLAVKYAVLGASLKLTATAASAQDTLTGIAAASYQEIANPEVPTSAEQPEYKKIAKWEDGLLKVYTATADGHTAGDYIYEDGKYDLKYANGEKLIEELFDIYDAFRALD